MIEILWFTGYWRIIYQHVQLVSRFGSWTKKNGGLCPMAWHPTEAVTSIGLAAMEFKFSTQLETPTDQTVETNLRQIQCPESEITCGLGRECEADNNPPWNSPSSLRESKQSLKWNNIWTLMKLLSLLDAWKKKHHTTSRCKKVGESLSFLCRFFFVFLFARCSFVCLPNFDVKTPSRPNVTEIPTRCTSAKPPGTPPRLLSRWKPRPRHGCEVLRWSDVWTCLMA